MTVSHDGFGCPVPRWFDFLPPQPILKLVAGSEPSGFLVPVIS